MIALNLGPTRFRPRSVHEARQTRAGIAPIVIDGGDGAFGYGISGGLEGQFVSLGEGYGRIYRRLLEESPPIAIVTSVIRDMFRSLSLELRRVGKDGKRTKVDKHPLYDLINEQPNELCSASEFWATVAEELVHGGECIVRVHRDRGTIRRLVIWPYNDTKISPTNAPRITASGEQQTFTYHYEGTEVEWVPGEVPPVMHVRMTIDRYHPLRAEDPWRGLHQEVLGSIHAALYRSEYFRQGGSPRLVATTKAMEGVAPTMTEQDEKDYEARLTAFFRVAKAPLNWGDGKARTLPENVEPYDLGPKSPTDPMLIEAARFLDERLSSAVGLPLITLNNLQKSTYANARQQWSQLVRSAIQPRINAFAAAIKRDLLMPMGGRNATLEPYINTEVLVQDEAVVFNKIIMDQVKGDVRTKNEAREAFGLEPLPELDDADDSMMGRDDEDEKDADEDDGDDKAAPGEGEKDGDEDEKDAEKDADDD